MPAADGAILSLRVRKHPEVRELSREIVNLIFSRATALLPSLCREVATCSTSIQPIYGEGTSESRVPVLQGSSLLPSALVDPEQVNSFLNSEGLINQNRSRMKLKPLPTTVYFVDEIVACKPPAADKTKKPSPGGCSKLNGRMILLALRPKQGRSYDPVWIQQEATLLIHELLHTLGADHPKPPCDDEMLQRFENCEDSPTTCRNLMNPIIHPRCSHTLELKDCNLLHCSPVNALRSPSTAPKRTSRPIAGKPKRAVP